MKKTFKSNRINNSKIALMKLGIFLIFLFCIYTVITIQPDLMENTTMVFKIVLIFVLGFIFYLFQNIFRKRVNEITIDTDQHLLIINYYSLIEGNVHKELLVKNIVLKIKESDDYSFEIYNKSNLGNTPFLISVHKDGFNKTTFKELIDLLILLTKEISK